jgi:hypothetical protein
MARVGLAATAAVRRAAVPARQVAAFAESPPQAAALAPQVAVFAERPAQAAVLAQQVEAFVEQPAQAAWCVADPARPAVASPAQFARQAEWAPAGSAGRYQPAGGPLEALRAALRPAERLAASAARAALIAALPQAVVAIAGPAAAPEAEEALLSVVAEVAAALRGEAARLGAAVGPAALQPEARAPVSRPGVFQVRVFQVRELAPALVQAGSWTGRSRACRQTSRRRPESYWSSAAGEAISLLLSLGGGYSRDVAESSFFLILAHDASQRTSKS